MWQTKHFETVVTKQKRLLRNNLLALGFVNAASNDQNMFPSPTRKDFEVVTHFLFSKLDEVSSNDYKIVWPLVTADDHREFQKTTFLYLKRIAEESEINFPNVSLSVLASKNDACYRLYFALSTHVVMQVNKQYGVPMLRPPKSKTSLVLKKQSLELLRMSVISTEEQFTALTDATKCHLDIYFRIAQNLTNCVDKLKLDLATNGSILEEKIKQAILVLAQSIKSTETLLEGLQVQSQENKAKVEALWKKLETFLSREESLWNSVEAQFEEDDAKLTLRGRDVMFPIPNHKQVEVCEEKHEGTSEAQYSRKNESLSILEYVKFINVGLEFYVRSIEKNNFSATYMCKSLNDKLGLESTLSLLQSMCTLLEESNSRKERQVEILTEGFTSTGLLDKDSVCEIPLSLRK